MILKKIFTEIYFNISIFDPDTKSVEHKHTLSVQHRLILTDRAYCNGIGGRTTELQTLVRYLVTLRTTLHLE